MTPDPTTHRLALAALVGQVIFWVGVVVLGAATPGYVHVADFISALGAVEAPDATLQRLNFGGLGVGVLAFTTALHRWFGDGRWPRPSTVLVAVLGLGVLGAGVFQAYPTVGGSTTHRVHNAASVIGLLAGVGGGRRARQSPPRP